jgi:hypothetical protein
MGRMLVLVAFLFPASLFAAPLPFPRDARIVSGGWYMEWTPSKKAYSSTKVEIQYVFTRFLLFGKDGCVRSGLEHQSPFYGKWGMSGNVFSLRSEGITEWEDPNFDMTLIREGSAFVGSYESKRFGLVKVRLWRYRP